MCWAEWRFAEERNGGVDGGPLTARPPRMTGEKTCTTETWRGSRKDLSGIGVIGPKEARVC